MRTTNSKSSPETASKEEPTSGSLTAIGILSVIGAALASVSLYEHTAQLNNIQVSAPLCTINETFNCAAVNSSHHSMFLGMPVASWGISYFLAQLSLSIAAQTGTGVARNLLGGLTTLGVAFCLYLFLVSVFAVHAVCPLCLGVYIITIASFVLSILAMRPESIMGSLKSSFATLRRLLPGATPMGSQHRHGILMALFIGLIGIMAPDFMLVKLIAPAADAKQKAEAESQALQTWHNSEEVAHDLITETGPSQDYGYGDLSAPIQIVEFSDFQCPFCRRLAGELEEIVQDYPGKVRVVVRNFPLDSSCNPQMPQQMHPLACAAATLARCAGEQGQFAKVANWINGAPELSGESLSAEQFEKIISEYTSSAGLDTQALSECRSAQRTKDKIASDAQLAVELGLQGTPLVFVNGKKLDYPTKDVLKQIIVEILTQPKNAS